MNQELVSLIIPVYNVSNYLEKCLDSVLTQTYKNIQVILINDGSTDDSGEICSRYAKINNWDLINKENGGLSSARNAGLEIKKGNYVCFIDSDDWIENNFIEELVNASKKYDADIVECGLFWRYEDETIVDCESSLFIYDNKDASLHYLLQDKKIHSAVCCKIYKSYIFDSLEFEVGKLHEDGYFMYQALYKVDKFVILPKALYNYRQNRKGSIMSSTPKPKNYFDVIEMMEIRNNFYLENNSYKLLAYSKAYYFRTLLTYYCNNKKMTKYCEVDCFLKNRLCEYRKDILKNRALGIKKIKFIAFFYARPLFEFIYCR